jgi:hypothetical protein
VQEIRLVSIGATLGDADTSDADISVSCISDVSSVTLHDDDDVDSVGDNSIDSECSLLASAHIGTEAALAMLTDTVLCLVKTEEQVLLPKSVRFQLGVIRSLQHQQHLFEQVRRHRKLFLLHAPSITARNPFAIQRCASVCYVTLMQCVCLLLRSFFCRITTENIITN